VRRVTTANIERKLSSMRDTPAAANNLRKLARLHRHAIKLGWRQDNPVDATDAFRTGKGFHAWTESEIDAFDAKWPFGTRERAGQRTVARNRATPLRCLKVGPADGRGRTGPHHSKNDSGTMVPMGPDLPSPAHFPGGARAIWKPSSESRSPRPASTTGSSAPVKASGTAPPRPAQGNEPPRQLARPFSKAAP
jgi:hypothetical protein